MLKLGQRSDAYTNNMEVTVNHSKSVNKFFVFIKQMELPPPLLNLRTPIKDPFKLGSNDLVIRQFGKISGISPQ